MLYLFDLIARGIRKQQIIREAIIAILTTLLVLALFALYALWRI